MPNNFYFGLLYTILNDEKNSRTIHAYSNLRLMVKPSAPFADMSPSISYKVFYLCNLLTLEDFFYQVVLYKIKKIKCTIRETHKS